MRYGRIAAWLCPFILLTGCWNNIELSDRGLVMALAVDQEEKGKIKLTTQVYKPVSEKGAASAQKTEKAFVNVSTIDNTLFEAVRDISIHLGRRAQFSHLQVIIIGEKFARKNMDGMLDLFVRDPELRLNTYIIIGEGKAETYLKETPFIENTMGRQLKVLQTSSSRFAGKTAETTLLNLALQFKSEVGHAMVGYVYTDRSTNNPLVAGLGLAKNGKMIGKANPEQAQFILMLANQFRFGIIEIPCQNIPDQYESYEVTGLNTTIKPTVKGDNLEIKINTDINGSIGELTCTTLKTRKDEARYAKKIEQHVKHKLTETMAFLQKQKLDVINVGNQLYQTKPGLWKRWKSDWPERFANAKTNITVDVAIRNSKMMEERPALRKE